MWNDSYLKRSNGIPSKHSKLTWILNGLVQYGDEFFIRVALRGNVLNRYHRQFLKLRHSFSQIADLMRISPKIFWTLRGQLVHVLHYFLSPSEISLTFCVSMKERKRRVSIGLFTCSWRASLTYFLVIALAISPYVISSLHFSNKNLSSALSKTWTKIRPFERRIGDAGERKCRKSWESQVCPGEYLHWNFNL